jgi:hypothetical protein
VCRWVTCNEDTDRAVVVELFKCVRMMHMDKKTLTGALTWRAPLPPSVPKEVLYARHLLMERAKVWA